MNQNQSGGQKSKCRCMTMVVLIGTMAVVSNIGGIKNAYATGEMLMGVSNDASDEATELHSSDTTNTLMVEQDTPAPGFISTGHAIHAVSNGTNYGAARSDAVHAWAGANAGHGVYGESSSTYAGVKGFGNKAPGGEFAVSDIAAGATYRRGAIRLVPQNLATASSCYLSGDLAIQASTGDLHLCKGGLWKKVVLQ